MENWKNTVTDEDIIFHLGDIAAAIRGRDKKLVEIFSELPGKKYLARGNHDHKTDEFYKNELGFEEVASYFVFEDILLCHYPLITNSYSKPREILLIDNLKKAKEHYGVTKIIHGHTHNRDVNEPNHYNVSVERINYSPVLIDDVLS
jgi:calcineurin-like phosphoesterase family protein